jgi:SanA protein
MRDGAPARPPRRRRWARWLLAVAAAGLGAVVAMNVRMIEAARPATAASIEAAPVRPYAIVLGNTVFKDGSPSPELAERLETALAVYRAQRAGKVIVSGLTRGDYDEPRAMAAWLRARGVPAGDVVLDAGGHRTAATMADAAALGVRAALVVTQGYHLPRSLYLARHAGIDAIGVAAPSSRPNGLRTFVREGVARAETVLEVAVRGVR